MNSTKKYHGIHAVAELGFQFRGGKIKRKNILNMLINNKLTITK